MWSLVLDQWFPCIMIYASHTFAGQTRTRTFTYPGINFITAVDTGQANQEKGTEIKQRLDKERKLCIKIDQVDRLRKA